MLVTEKKECRSCKAELEQVPSLLNLGMQAVVDFLSDGETGRGVAPLDLVRCKNCGLVQLRHTVDADALYRKFWYRSSVNEQMRAALWDVVSKTKRKTILHAGDAVCDIGSNDGELLLNYQSDVMKVGFEPAEDLATDSASRLRDSVGNSNWQVIPQYFNAHDALKVAKEYKVITAISMFYDLDNPRKFLADVKECLAPEGVFVVQMNYLVLMLRNLSFDNICHEHLCYYSLTDLARLFGEAGLEIFDVEVNAVNGGSIRVYASHKGKTRHGNVNDYLTYERGQLSDDSFVSFVERVKVTRSLLLKFMKELKKAGKKVYAYGASTRGTTLLQVLFDGEKATDYVVAAAERDERKFGKKMAGVNVPIVSEHLGRSEADYMLLLPYHFWESISRRERAWMEAGGKFILPLPYPKVVRFESRGLVAYDLLEELEAVKV